MTLFGPRQPWKTVIFCKNFISPWSRKIKYEQAMYHIMWYKWHSRMCIPVYDYRVYSNLRLWIYQSTIMGLGHQSTFMGECMAPTYDYESYCYRYTNLPLRETSMKFPTVSDYISVYDPRASFVPDYLVRGSFQHLYLKIPWPQMSVKNREFWDMQKLHKNLSPVKCFGYMDALPGPPSQTDRLQSLDS